MGSMENFLWSIDLSIFKFINQSLSFQWLDQITPILTDLDHNRYFFYPLVLFVLFSLIKKYKRLGITYFLFLILALATSDFSGGRIKKLVQRPRPFQITETSTILKSTAKKNRSFYSNHASNTFTAAAYLSAFFPAGQILLFAAASVIALTRVHVGVHYPSDILTGALVGILWGWLFSQLIKKLIFKIKNKNESPD